MPATKPTLKILDLFCGAGGAAVGLHRAFPEAEITGVDIKPQKNYPFHFVQADALEFPLDGYDFIWASPPCQGYSVTKSIHWCQKIDYPKLIGGIRKRLHNTEAYWVIENVGGAKYEMPDSLLLCGLMFDLKVIRHRLFESNFFVLAPAHPSHIGVRIGKDGFCCVAGHGDSGNGKIDAFHRRKSTWEKAIGIDWMTMYELTQSVPPAYSEFIGRQLKNIMERKRAAV